MTRRRARYAGSTNREQADLEADEAARLAAHGDADAFARLCRGLQNDVWRYCWSLTGDRDLADEATQETFLRATSALHRFRGDAPVRIWFVVLARRSVGEVLRRHKRTPEPAEPTNVAVPDNTAATDLNGLVEALPIDVRQAFVLTQLLGFTYDDAATAVGCPIGTIRSRVFRARELLVEMCQAHHSREEVLDENG